MKRIRERTPPGRQRGWAALIGLVIALVIVAMLAKTVLEQYGMTRKPGPAGAATGLGPVPHETTSVVPAPRDAMERARGLESQVQQQAIDNAKRIDDALRK
jgi:hypothetical protein